MMGWLLGCFRVAGYSGEGRRERERDQLVSSPSVSPPVDAPKVGERKRPPSKNALSAVFLREDEGSRVEHSTSLGANGITERTKVDQEHKNEVRLLIHRDALVEATNEIIKGTENTDQSQTHLTCLPAISDDLQFMEGLKAEACQTPSGSHQSSILPDAMSSSWKECDASNQNDSEAVCKSIEVEVVGNDDSAINCGNKLTALDSPSFTCRDDINLVESKSSPISTPSEATAEIQTPATTHAPDQEELRNENNTRTCSEHTYEAVSSVEASGSCEKLRLESCQPNISDEDFKYAKNDSLVSVELSISNECSLFQSSEGSVSSCNKRRENSSTESVEKCLKSEPLVHSSRKKVLKGNDSEVEFPSLSQWLKPPNPKVFRDEPLTSDRSHSAKSSEEDRPIIGLVAAHWRDTEPDTFTPKWWDGNGIPNSTNKYKEDQKVSWHATPFEERLEKALSDEKLLSQRKCSSGNTSQLSGLEGEENDTAASTSNYLCVAAIT
ncbi:protein JASON-like [Oryza glaberrima]|uniref:Protein JASON-like n=2 Tax=Oryza barthii TaxID=65489 RepID=A0A0D3FPQ5_9ORYZ|nr:protein JASON-like [Oryza glaberrima]